MRGARAAGPRTEEKQLVPTAPRARRPRNQAVLVVLAEVPARSNILCIVRIYRCTFCLWGTRTEASRPGCLLPRQPLPLASWHRWSRVPRRPWRRAGHAALGAWPKRQPCIYLFCGAHATHLRCHSLRELAEVRCARRSRWDLAERLQSGSFAFLEALRNQRGLGDRSGASPLGCRLALLKEPLVRQAPR